MKIALDLQCNSKDCNSVLLLIKQVETKIVTHCPRCNANDEWQLVAVHENRKSPNHQLSGDYNRDS